MTEYQLTEEQLISVLNTASLKAARQQWTAVAEALAKAQVLLDHLGTLNPYKIS